MTTIAGAWLQDMKGEPLPSPIIGAAEFGSCLERCPPTMSSVECGVECSRSLDVHSRGLPILVPFKAQQQKPQFVGWSMRAHECASSQQSQFNPNPMAPTIIAFAERNP